MSDIRLIEIDVAHVGQPRNDGTRGSALYRVPIKLNEVPSPLWAEVAVQIWDNPPSFTTMHRSGIASVEGDCFVLDGTTIEEVEQHHVETLKLVVDRANAETRRIDQEEKVKREREEAASRDHKASVAEAAKRITFD
jgi:hypothetical protein